MIYTIEENRHLEYSTPLIDYIKSKHLYTNENLIYTKKILRWNFFNNKSYRYIYKL